MRKFLIGFGIGIVLTIIFLGLPLAVALRQRYFTDVPSNKWYTEAVNEMAAIGVFDGYPDSSFRPGNYVNRAELAQSLQQMLRHFEQVEGLAPGSTASAYSLPTPSPSLSHLPPGYSYAPPLPIAPASIQPPPPPSPSPSPSPPPSSSTAFSSSLNAAYQTPIADSIDFITRSLSTSAGALFANMGTGYAGSNVSGVNHEVLSESFGLYFNALAYANRSEVFEREYQFFTANMLAGNNFAYWRLNENLTPYERTNATIDDLKIIKGLLRGYERFGLGKYRDTALAMANAHKNYALRNGIVTDYVSWDSNGQTHAADRFTLGYPDFETMRMLSPYDSAWNTILTNTIAVVKNGQFSNGLFQDQYAVSSGQYSNGGDLHMIFQAYAAENLARAGETAAAQRFLTFAKNEWNQRGKIFAHYTAAGSPSVSYEDLAVYSIIARTALVLNDTQFAAQLAGKILNLQNKMIGSPWYGAFLWSTNEVVYSFSQINALYTLALFANTSLQPTTPPSPSGSSSSGGSGVTAPPPTPGPAPVITAQNYVLWHMSDIFYGTHHVPDLTEMVNDMDTLQWNDALIAGDMSGNGSVENLSSMKNVFVSQSSHPWSAFNFLAGNHEYNCGGTPTAGCLNNYKSIINPTLRYTFDRGNVHFIVMSIDGGSYRMSDETMAWLRSEVAANQGKILVLATHQMPHALGDTSPRAQEILDQLGIDIWLFGHAHCKHGDTSCTRHGAYGDFYVQSETTFVDAGYIGNHESRYLIFTEGSNQVRILSRNHSTASFQPQFEHTATLRHPFQL